MLALRLPPSLVNLKPAEHRRLIIQGMDTLDLKILASLEADARRPFADLARELEVSQPTVADRVRRLEERGILKGTQLRVDPARLGFAIHAFVRLKSAPPQKRGLYETAQSIPQIMEMHAITGEDCVIARVVARSVEELGAILERLNVFGQSSTSIVLETPIPLRNPILQPVSPKPKASATRKGRAPRAIPAQARP
jgi:Lrp/AsnC family transcriptional regulator, leucine-responsive regulatory protein